MIIGHCESFARGMKTIFEVRTIENEECLVMAPKTSHNGYRVSPLDGRGSKWVTSLSSDPPTQLPQIRGPN